MEKQLENVPTLFFVPMYMKHEEIFSLKHKNQSHFWLNPEGKVCCCPKRMVSGHFVGKTVGF